MKRCVFADYKEYNANSRDNNTGDCVKRSLALAYGLDYDKVSNELNQIKRDKGRTAFNQPTVFNAFIDRHGCQAKGKPQNFGIPADITVSEFCQRFPKGTYILLCGKTSDITSHMVCIIDGDFWDSWNSGDYKVITIYEISRSQTAVQELDVSAISIELFEHVQKCIDKSKSKMPYAEFEFGKLIVIDHYTVKQTIVCHIDPDSTDGLYRFFLPDYTYTIKLNPRMTAEENLSSLKDKLWFKIREWAYSVRKEVEDLIACQNLKTHPDFYGSKDILVKLPEWCRSKVREIEDKGQLTDYGSRYQVYMDALEGDPRKGSDPEVAFYADTLTELRSQLADYKKDYSRVMYDY